MGEKLGRKRGAKAKKKGNFSMGLDNICYSLFSTQAARLLEVYFFQPSDKQETTWEEPLMLNFLTKKNLLDCSIEPHFFFYFSLRRLSDGFHNNFLSSLFISSRQFSVVVFSFSLETVISVGKSSVSATCAAPDVWNHWGKSIGQRGNRGTRCRTGDSIV